MQTYKKKLDKLVKNYFQGNFSNTLLELESLSKQDINDSQRITLQKISCVFFLGQLLGLPTLHSILEHYGLKNHYLQLDYRALNKTMSNSLFWQLFSNIFEHTLGKEIERLSKLDPSVWSRKTLTSIIDDSVFRQWLSRLLSDPYWGSFFSGQIQRTAYGFKVVTLGVSIDGVFYPLYIDFVKKKKDNQVDDKQMHAIEVAKGLVDKFALFIQKLKNKGIELPTLYMSFDSGYNDEKLIHVCENHGIVYIGVPQKSHLVEVEGQKMSIKDLTDKFEQKEQQNKAEQGTAEAFVWRTNAMYVSKKVQVVLLLFRLNKSNKVSVIFTTHQSIFAKTLRRHWFDRTYIEQFFKLLKHSMKIQMSKTSTKEKFEQKLWLFMFIALHLQLLVRIIQKNTRSNEHRKIGLESLKNLLRSQNSTIEHLLEQQLIDPFCNEDSL